MGDFDHALFTDSNLRLTSSVWDANVASWMMKTQNYVMSSGGLLWIPLTLDDDGNLKASVKNSALPIGAATEATIASILAKIIAAPSTAANQATIISALTDIKGMDLRGEAANKPLANAVTIGVTYWSVDTDPHGDAIEVSNGTSWVVI